MPSENDDKSRNRLGLGEYALIAALAAGTGTAAPQLFDPLFGDRSPTMPLRVLPEDVQGDVRDEHTESRRVMRDGFAEIEKQIEKLEEKLEEIEPPPDHSWRIDALERYLYTHSHKHDDRRPIPPYLSPKAD